MVFISIKIWNKFCTVQFISYKFYKLKLFNFMSIFIWAFLGAKGLRPTYTLGNTVAVPLFPFVATQT